MAEFKEETFDSLFTDDSSVDPYESIPEGKFDPSDDMSFLHRKLEALTLSRLRLKRSIDSNTFNRQDTRAVNLMISRINSEIKAVNMTIAFKTSARVS